MRNKILILAALIPLAGCGAYERAKAQATGYSLVCIKETGTVYVQFASGAAPLMTRDGNIAICSDGVVPAEENAGGAFAD